MQSAYIGKLMELAEKDANVLHILSDSGTGYDELFRRNFPRQIFNFGIGEENMVTAASGMATVGKIPFVFTAGAFLAYRSYEFIRDDVCFQNQNVKIVGMGSGLAWSSLGPTHHTTEDISVLRSIPNLMVLSPSTPRQVAECVELAYEHKGPVYIRIGMNHEREFFDETYKMSASGFDSIVEGNDICVIATGSILDEVYEAVNMLSEEGVSISLVNAAIIKPFDYSYIDSLLPRFRHIITVEEHNIYGGLGSIVAEHLSRLEYHPKLGFIGINDTFASGYGTHKMVRTANGLDAVAICEKIRVIAGL